MTYEEAINILADDYSLCPSECEGDCNKCVKGAKGMAIEALEKQIPKKPKAMTNYYPEGQFECSECGCGIIGLFRKAQAQKYCLNCGQALDWSDFQ